MSTSATRVRRATSKVVNYAREQEFSDAEDLFGDDASEDERPAPQKRSTTKRGGGRKAMTTTTRTATTTTTDHVYTGGDSGNSGGDLYNGHQQRPVYTEKGYDLNFLPLRERFPFLPETEDDGSPKIELIVGRRPIDEKEDKDAIDEDEEEEMDAVVDGQDVTKNKRKSRTSTNVEQTTPDKKSTRRAAVTATTTIATDDNNLSATKTKVNASPSIRDNIVEYEYLVKFKGKSYLHLEWMSGADLESMNRSAKGIYRRYLKKVALGVDDELENPEFDPSYIIPEKVIDEADQEIDVDLTDKELMKWEKERDKEMAEEDEDDGADEKKILQNGDILAKEKNEDKDDTDFEWPDKVDYKNIDIGLLRKVMSREDPYYPVIEGSDNPYRDGYITEPPKKPRASYLFFQCAMRSYVTKKHPKAVQSELMSMLGEAWRSMTDKHKEPFQVLADEEHKQYERERVLLEKAQKPNGVWQPLRRCRQVLERLASDSFADIFLEPVNLEDFPDYEEIIDSPMDLGTVRQNIINRKYMVPEQFARDMRRVWNNCKIYNQHGTAIWHVADYMSKQFERLYHSWVLEFRERYQRWADPRARPWEHSCRIHDGKCGTPDDKMVLCDHCDGMYGLKCLTPTLKKVPSKAWHCPDCKPKLRSAKGARMLSAVAENVARKRAEFGDLPQKKITQTMYLVKWQGLGYEYCTWETKEDVGNDALINEFHQLNHGYSDEADMPEQMLDDFMSSVKHVSVKTAGGIGNVPVLRSQLYAQTRGLHFVKFGMDVPKQVCTEMGPQSIASRCCPRFRLTDFDDNEITKSIPREVVECVANMTLRVVYGAGVDPVLSNSYLPPLLNGEYDVVVPITSKGLMMNVGEINGNVAFLGYRKFPDGSPGPSEIRRLIRSNGDIIIAVDGQSTVGKSFKEVISMLRESGKNKFAYMRFLEGRMNACNLDYLSVGVIGRYAYDELRKKYSADRQRILIQRKINLVEEGGGNDKQENASVGSADSDAESEAGSEGSFQPDSDDEDLGDTVKVQEVSPKDKGINTLPDEKATADALAKPLEKNVEVSEYNTLPAVQSEVTQEIDDKLPFHTTLIREETTRSLGLRLLDIDLGYSSDEGGEEECAYFIDGVDETFVGIDELDIDSSETTEADKETIKHVGSLILPASQTEFSTLGDRAKLAAVVALTKKAPTMNDFESFPEVFNEEKALSPSLSTERSNVKIEQVDPATGDIIHVWPTIEVASATLQLPLPDLKALLRGEYDDEIGEEIGGFKWRYALANAKVTAGNVSTTRGGGGKKAKEAWLQFRDKLYDPSDPHIYKDGNRLRDYQVDGVNWLASTWYKRQGCVLADEMGLGKTVQIVCYIEHLYRVEKIKRPFLVVVPLSTIEHWRREFQGWTDMVCCVYHDRQRIWRDIMREYEWYFEDRPHTAEFLKFDVLVTTYDTLIGDFDVISQIPFRVSVVDEAHRLRNQKGKLLECMKEISAKGNLQYGFQSRVLMSGTPLQNDLNELWTLLNFIEPSNFPDLGVFQMNFGNMANRSQVEALQQMISPFMLRRVKEDVAKDIPAKEETVIDVELTNIQKQYYRAIFEHNHSFLNMGAARNSAPKLMNIQMELRKVCNHPFLLDGVEHRETDRQFKEFFESGAFDGKTPEKQQYMISEHGFIMTSGKMLLLDKLLPKLHQEGHKILIFSQMVKMLDLISEYCDFRSYRYERLDGRVRGTERQKAIDRFEKEKDSFLFLLSTRAGGVGINLTAADTVIIFDSDWNPQNDVQAQARCHRIGQTKDVRIYRLVTSRSFEQEMFDRASRKLGLEQAVLGTFEKDADEGKPSQEEMEQLLKKGAYALLEDDNDEVIREFCTDDIDSILAKRTRTRVVEGAKTASWLNKQGMVVSRSKFGAEPGGVDMDDPLFWQKVMPDLVTPSLLLRKLNEIEDEIEGRKRGPGRGRWRKKRAEEAAAKAAEEASKSAVAPTIADCHNAGEGNAMIGERNGDATQKEIKISNDFVSTTNNPNKGAQSPGANDEGELNADEVEVTTHGGDEASDANDSIEKHDETSEDESNRKKTTTKLSKTNMQKLNKFMSDLKSMMEALEDEEDEEGLSAEERSACQKLLLNVSMKQKLFSETQRRVAKKYLDSFEGDRRRRCRTSDQTRFQPGRNVDDDEPTAIREELRITGKKRRKRRTREEMEAARAEAAKLKEKKKSTDESGGYVGEDGYLHHSDSDGEWSTVEDDIYQSSKKDRISRKQANQRRAWGTGDDVATSAGRAWPVFPRPLVKKVLKTVLEKVIKYDEDLGGAFSVPVSKEEFPEYYEQIKKPMDYNTMMAKLENGEYRSAQAMQKDFILIMQNCRQFNANNSEIVRAAREQFLMRPKFLKEAAEKHNLFLAEDGSVFEIQDDKPTVSSKNASKQKNKKEDEGEDDDDYNDSESLIQKTKNKSKKSAPRTNDADPKSVPQKLKSATSKAKTRKSESIKDQDPKKPRIQIKVKNSKKSTKRKRDEEDEADKRNSREDSAVEVNPREKKRSKNDVKSSVKKRPSGKATESNEPFVDVVARKSRMDDSRAADGKSESVFLDIEVWESSRKTLDGSFKAARKNLRKAGPWKLPPGISDDKFADVAYITLDKMNKHDGYSIFAKEVLEEEAPGYNDVVKFPMDFSKMRSKVRKGEYGIGSIAASALYKDFNLVFDNCFLYNDEDGEVAEEASRILGLLPESYVAACAQVLKRG